LTQSSSDAPKDTSTPTPEPELSPEELEEYADLRSLLSPKVSLGLLDDFAKWLFALAGTVGSIGAGFGVTGVVSLSATGKSRYADAVVCVAISLALAALSRLPLPARVNRYSPVSMRRAIRRIIWLRFGLLGLAALAFATGIALAGYALIA
jgi:hypothetical protein